MIYEFTDTIEQPGVRPLPAEALQINGEYIENLIDGYRTLTVQGREALSCDVSTEEAGLRPGTIYISRKYPERIITIQYQIIAQTTAGFREAYNKLASVLDVEEARLVFADEPDKYFVGTPGTLENVEPGKLSVISSFQIVCADPFKYSVREFTAEDMQDGTLYCKYNGTFPAHPKFTAQFLQEGDVTESGAAGEITGEGECGFIAFFDEDEHVLLFGDPEEADGEDLAETQTLLAANLNTSSAWTSTVQNRWPTNNGAAVLDINAVQTGTAGMIPFTPNPGASQYYTGAVSYGSGAKWHGPGITCEIPEDALGETRAENFVFQYAAKCCTDVNTTTAAGQIGGISCYLSDSEGNRVIGVRIYKSAAGQTGFVSIVINGVVVDRVSIDMGYNNQYFGNNRNESYKTVGGKKVLVPAIKTQKTVRIAKVGTSLQIDAGGVIRSYEVEDLPMITRITFQFQAYGTKPTLSWLGIYNWKFDKLGCDTWKDVKNKFTAGDRLDVDVSDGTILLNDKSFPGLGALGNQWEEFALHPGENQIGWACSDWCRTHPSVGMKYREVYL